MRQPTINEQEKMVPPTNHGVKLMSMGFLLRATSRSSGAGR